jgi:hypothetical protein
VGTGSPGADGSEAAAAGASSVGTGSPGADGSEAAAAGAGSAPEGSVWVDDSGAAVAASGSSWSCTTLAALLMSKPLFYRPNRARYLCDQR